MDLTIPERFQSFLRIGTCSWKYDSWKGLLYPEKGITSNDDYLPYYAKRLKTVEIDQWFWSLFPGGVKLPEPGTVELYARQVSDDFEFTIKVPNSITLTHYYTRQSKKYASYAGEQNPHFLSFELTEQFLETLQPLGNKIGPIMFQFEYLNKKKMPSRKAFFDRLHEFFSRLPTGLPFTIEIRNPNYISVDLFEFLREHRISFVFLEGYFMPHIGEIFSSYDTITADFVVIRLHGPDRQKIEKQTGSIWNEIVQPHDKSLSTVSVMVQELARQNIKSYINVNNHFEGSAPLTIQRLLDKLEDM